MIARYTIRIADMDRVVKPLGWAQTRLRDGMTLLNVTKEARLVLFLPYLLVVTSDSR
jgi:hypothetical protein